MFLVIISFGVRDVRWCTCCEVLFQLERVALLLLLLLLLALLLSRLSLSFLQLLMPLLLLLLVVLLLLLVAVVLRTGVCVADASAEFVASGAGARTTDPPA